MAMDNSRVIIVENAWMSTNMRTLLIKETSGKATTATTARPVVFYLSIHWGHWPASGAGLHDG